MLNWLDLKKGSTLTAKEMVHPDMTAEDVSDTQNELYRLDSDLWKMIRGLTVAHRQELNEKVRKFCQECQMEYMQAK